MTGEKKERGVTVTLRTLSKAEMQGEPPIRHMLLTIYSDGSYILTKEVMEGGSQ